MVMVKYPRLQSCGLTMSRLYVVGYISWRSVDYSPWLGSTQVIYCVGNVTTFITTSAHSIRHAPPPYQLELLQQAVAAAKTLPRAQADSERAGSAIFCNWPFQVHQFLLPVMQQRQGSNRWHVVEGTINNAAILHFKAIAISRLHLHSYY